MVQWMVNDAREVAWRRARDVIAGTFEGDELKNAILELQKLYVYVPYDPAALREAIVPKVLEKGGYPFDHLG
jgi:hypothetical protein